MSSSRRRKEREGVRLNSRRVNVKEANFSTHIRMNRLTRHRFNQIADIHESRTGKRLSDGKVIELVLEQLYLGGKLT